MFLKRYFCTATDDVEIDRKGYRVVLTGDTLSGKTCLLTSFLYHQFNPNHVFVLDKISHSKTIQIDDKSIDLSFVDTLGLSDFDRLRSFYYACADIVLICFNIDDPESITTVVEKWISEIRHIYGQCPVILVACKIDLREDPRTISKLKQRDELPIKTKVGKKVASKIHADGYMECSAKTQEGVQELCVAIVRLVLKKHHYTK